MVSTEKLKTLNTLFADVSLKLSAEISKRLPNALILKDYRKQLGQLDRDIRRIQALKDLGN